jgi:hypothetical protein
MRPRGPVPHDRVRPDHDPLSQTEANAMQNLTKMTAAAFAAFTLTACVEEGATRSDPAGMREASSAAESACMTHLNSQYGGNVARIEVLSSELSQANSEVTLAAVGVRGTNKTEKFRCLVSNDGQVQELSAVGN